MVQFKDIHKKAEDLLWKDWVDDKRAEVENNWKTGAFSFKNKSSVGTPFTVNSLLSGSAFSDGIFGGKVPVTSTEIGYDASDFQSTFKADSEGKVTEEFKVKNLTSLLGLKSLIAAAPAVSLNNKFSLGGGRFGYEAQAEVQQAGSHHSVLTVNPLKEQIVFSTGVDAWKNVVVGAEVSGPVNLLGKEKSYRGIWHYSLASTVALPEQNALIGATVAQAFGTQSVNVAGFVHLSQGKTESAVQASLMLGPGAIGGPYPSVTFVTKQHINKDLSVKASVNDNMLLKIAANWRVNANTVASIGAAYNNSIKAPAGDVCKFGLKLVFA